MKIKNIEVGIRPLKDVLSETAKVMNNIKKGKNMLPRTGLSFGSVDSFREFFTPKRIELLQVIKHKHPKSVYELAKLTNREFKNVSMDIKIMEKYGLLDTKKVPVKGRTGYRLVPIFDYDKLTVDIAM